MKKNIQARYNKNCDQIFFIFTGYGAWDHRHGLEFFEKAKLLDRNIVIFKDPHKKMYMNGIQEELTSFWKVIDQLKVTIREAPWVKRIYCIGNSAGGIAALLAGYHLKAEAVYGTAVIMPYTPVFCYGMGNHRLPRLIDPRRTLKQNNGVTVYNLYFHEGHKQDAAVAMKLARCPGVKLHPLDGSDHSVYGTLEESGQLETMLPPWTGEEANG